MIQLPRLNPQFLLVPQLTLDLTFYPLVFLTFLQNFRIFFQKTVRTHLRIVPFVMVFAIFMHTITEYPANMYGSMALGTQENTTG